MPLDAYLRKLGLYRKLVAKDRPYLFRAVAEQFGVSKQHLCDMHTSCDAGRPGSDATVVLVSGFIESSCWTWLLFPVQAEDLI